MKTTIALVLTILLLIGCDIARSIQQDPKNPARILALLVAIEQTKVSTEADLRAMRDAAPAAFDVADRNHDGILQPRELPRFLKDGKLPARTAFVQVLRNDSQFLRSRGDAESVAIADKIDQVLADVDGWLLMLDLLDQ